MSYPDLVSAFIQEAMAKHATELTDAAKYPHVKALLDLGYRFQTDIVMPERLDEGGPMTLVTRFVLPPTSAGAADLHDAHGDCPYPNGCESVGCLAGTVPGQVWVLAYQSELDEADNGVLGVYATEALARAAGIEEAGKDPNIAGREVRWEHERLIYQHGDEWYDVRPTHYVQGWDVKGT